MPLASGRCCPLDLAQSPCPAASRRRPVTSRVSARELIGVTPISTTDGAVSATSAKEEVGTVATFTNPGREAEWWPLTRIFYRSQN